MFNSDEISLILEHLSDILVIVGGLQNQLWNEEVVGWEPVRQGLRGILGGLFAIKEFLCLIMVVN